VQLCPPSRVPTRTACGGCHGKDGRHSRTKERFWSAHFLAWEKSGLRQRVYCLRWKRVGPTSRRLAPAMERIIEVVCGEYGICPEDPIGTRRVYFNEPRNVAVIFQGGYRRASPQNRRAIPFVQLQQRQQYKCQDEGRLQSDKAFRKRVEKIKSRL
jgi:hypothetical protein